MAMFPSASSLNSAIKWDRFARCTMDCPSCCGFQFFYVVYSLNITERQVAETKWSCHSGEQKNFAKKTQFCKLGT